ncbi:MAG: carboxypeptidase-like regulatory domain-containing protein, partial [Bacteroidota bacterium]|nr:carboxypeptidase-like regulatory domain-containing protein [Bacteroidota bacterium]
MRRILMLMLGLLLLNLQLLAQNRTVTGRVTDAAGNPISGASVQVKGTNVGTVTREDGSFSIAVAPSATTLTVSAVGQTPQEITIGSQTNFAVALQAGSQQNMQEVVVVGYGTQQRRSVTGAISRIGAEEITALPVPDPRQALQGRVPGVSVVNNGSPGET